MRTRVVLACALAVAAVQAPLAEAHEGNPNFRSEITGIDPATDGLDVEVLNFDDSLRLTNDSGETVTVFGYEDEPYARIEPDGTVEVNENSPAYYLNEDRFAEADVPANADPEAEPDWEQVDTTGEFSWHDHRSHYMAQGTPPQVKDESAETKVFDYAIPIEVGGSAGDDRRHPHLGRRGLGLPGPAVHRASAWSRSRCVAFAVVRRTARRPALGRRRAGEAKEAW